MLLSFKWLIEVSIKKVRRWIRVCEAICRLRICCSLRVFIPCAAAIEKLKIVGALGPFLSE